MTLFQAIHTFDSSWTLSSTGPRTATDPFYGTDIPGDQAERRSVRASKRSISWVMFQYLCKMAMAEGVTVIWCWLVWQ